ncbi:T9SS type A sorting domain-containing protein [Spirosoma sp. BT702]|uniref:T9SS type A sorting domain-containing protein n=1 Tax=Spirosoma profusum TaxID=2771354 RepID=A0A927AQU3_9BACT|nr:T9SS type A sorting domain-containing protein [Spirosoma profusum]MBD2701141.1 T9SS type A sorting domain-containing protein [Spirosoma profusum]
MKIVLSLLILLLSIQTVQATHLQGGHIQVKPVSGSALTYEIIVTISMDDIAGRLASDAATSISLCFGDGTVSEVIRQSRVSSADKLTSINIYRIIHTYPGPSNYNLTVALANRTVNNNITDANNQLFTLSTTFSTNVATPNQTPTPNLPEAFRIGVNQQAVLSLKATDPDGDSLVYGLAKVLTSTFKDACTYQLVPSYKFPNDVTRRGIFKLNNRSGELTWDAPTQQGNYSVAIVIFEYRNGVLISQTTQEISLIVEDKAGTPSTIPTYEPAMEGAIITAISEFSDADVTLTVFPNPVDDRLQVVIQTSRPGVASLQLFDNSGRNLHELSFKKASRQHEQVISMDSLSPGQYVLRADVAGRSVVRKIVKK